MTPLFFFLIIGLLMIYCWSGNETEVPQICIQDWQNNVTKCRPRCDNGYFSLYGMGSCQRWLACEDITQDVEMSDFVLGYGAVKMVTLGTWRGYKVAVSRLRFNKYVEDFVSNLETLLAFNFDGNAQFLNHLVQLVGFCNETEHVLITEYHAFGSADKFHLTMQTSLLHMDTVATRFSLCVDFVNILHGLHSHKNGPRVLCDSNTPEKSLSQFLLSDELKLLLNDMDALPVVNESNNYSIKCGHRELVGDFVAPEQLWPFDDIPFDENLMHGYNEKVDIWKVPDICMVLIGNSDGANRLLINLFNIHAKCKNELPYLRPLASEILEEYQSIWMRLNLNQSQNVKKAHIHDSL